MTQEEKLKSDLSHMEQIAFRLQTDLEFAMWEKAEKDKAFLLEMRNRLESAFENRDITQKDMVFKMIDDWVHELSAEPKTKKYKDYKTKQQLEQRNRELVEALKNTTYQLEAHNNCGWIMGKDYECISISKELLSKNSAPAGQKGGEDEN